MNVKEYWNIEIKFLKTIDKYYTKQKKSDSEFQKPTKTPEQIKFSDNWKLSTKQYDYGLNQQITNTTNVKLWCSLKREKKTQLSRRNNPQSTTEGKLSLINNYQKNIIANDLECLKGCI